MAYTTKYKYYRSEKVAIYFEKPILDGYKVSKDMIKKRIKTRLESAETSEESKNVSVARSRIKIYDMAIMNDWEWFVTFTFNPAKVDSFDYSETTKKLSTWLNNLKRDNPNMSYLIVPEKHLSGRFHFHALMSSLNPQIFDLSGQKDNKGRDIYNLGKYKFGWSTATKIGSNERAVKYLTKYITKDSLQVTKNKKKYWNSKNLLMPVVDKLDLNSIQQKHMLEFEKEKSTSAKVLHIDNGDYQNTLTICRVKL